MGKRIVYENDAGGISIIVPAPKALERMTIENIAAKDVPPGKVYHIVDVEDIPVDRSYRNAWRHAGGGKLKLDLAAAKSVMLDRVRERRNAKLDQLDKDQARANDQGKADELVEIKARKQTLRDLPAALAAQAAVITGDDIEQVSSQLMAIEAGALQ